MKRILLAVMALSVGSAMPAAAASVIPVAEGLEHPWGLAFMPDGKMLVTERPGRLRIIDEGKSSEPVANVPKVVARSQGGLLDVALHPQFAANRLIYLSFSEPREQGKNGTALARARLSDDGAALENVEIIFSQRPAINSGAHFGGRIAFAPDGNLFLTLGDRYSERDSAQDLSTHLGKTVRLTQDGKAAPGNPFLGKSGALPEIWSYGTATLKGQPLIRSPGHCGPWNMARRAATRSITRKPARITVGR